MEIILNKIYNYFDDGKINESRRLSVKIVNIVPFKDIDDEILSYWKDEVLNHNIYFKDTDYFLFGDLVLSNDCIEKIVFVRDIYNGWFSMGWWAGRLDHDGSLLKRLSQII